MPNKFCYAVHSARHYSANLRCIHLCWNWCCWFDWASAKEILGTVSFCYALCKEYVSGAADKRAKLWPQFSVNVFMNEHTNCEKNDSFALCKKHTISSWTWSVAKFSTQRPQNGHKPIMSSIKSSRKTAPFFITSYVCKAKLRVTLHLLYCMRRAKRFRNNDLVDGRPGYMVVCRINKFPLIVCSAPLSSGIRQNFHMKMI